LNNPFRRLTRPFTRAALLVATGLLAACTRGVEIESTWLDEVPRNQSFSNVLVVGVTPNFNLRCRFERAMAASLRSASVKATASCAEMSMTDPLTREGITPVVVALGADSVLTTELVDGTAKLVEGGTDEARGEAYAKATGYGYAYGYGHYGSYGLPVTYVEFTAEDPTFTLQRTVLIASYVYETRNASRVYALQTTARDKQSREEVLDVVTFGVAERLRRDGLMR
jgi:hypothetical protein